jgi:hypothetical protein
MRFINFGVHSPILLAASIGAATLMPLLPTWADAPPAPSQSTPGEPAPSSSPQPTTQETQTAPTARRFEGEVEKYLLNREGIVNGLLLTNGVQVRFPSQLSKNLMETAEVGDSVIVIGSAGVPNALGQEVQAESIANKNNDRTVSTMVNYSNMSVEGAAQRWLIGKRGEIRGVVLSNGAQVEFSPRIGNQLSPMAKPGARIQAQGVGISNDYGQVLEASNLTVDGKAIEAPPPSPGPKERRRGPGPDATNRPTPPNPDAARPALPLR